jgi:hypothetical protein
MAKKVSTREASGPISRREAFVSHGALSARGHSGPADSMIFGELPQDQRETIRKLPDINYVVSSYNTPIGVHSHSQGWVIPNTKYSRTTSKHQSQLRRGAAESGSPVKYT